jgi:hypothetical protein
MGKHSKNVTNAPTFRQSERERLDWGTQTQRVGSDSLKALSSCCICLHVAVDPVICGGRLQLSLIGRLHVASVASKNHEKGDVFVKNDQTVDGAYFFNLITTETAPKIREQFADAELVYLQIDNAPGHTGKDNSTEIERAVNEDGQKPFIKIVFQPANSPDLNLNDLGVFYSMQQMYRVIRTRAKLKAAARQIESAPLAGGVGTRGQRAAAAVGARSSAPAMRRDATPSPTPKPSLPIGCAGFHNNEADADMALQFSIARRSRKCLTAVINSHLAHMRIEFSCTASSMIVSVTNAGSSRSCRPMQISVARSRIKPMCVVAAMISLTRRAHCLHCRR